MTRFETPILFLIFNRPNLSEITFQKIRDVRPAKLFIAADGPRVGHQGDLVNCSKTRETVLSMIDWECEVKTFFRDENLGCGRAVSSAITWYFDQVEQGIILEDDCMPIPFFFEYAQILLNRYKTNTNVMHISGNNFVTSFKTQHGILFSKYPHSWGWATWRDRWFHYTLELPNASTNFNLVDYGFLNKQQRKYWVDVFKNTQSRAIETWDYQWFHTLWRNNGVAIIPRYNLVTNIGFGEEATNTKSLDDRFSSIITKEFTLTSYPPSEQAVKSFDDEFFKIYLKEKFDVKFIFGKLKAILPWG